jgi:tetratricopeptide (TPR) repeat protein
MAEISSTSTKKLSLRRSITRKRLALIAGVFFVITFLIWGIPVGLALFYQNLGGTALQQVVKEIDEYQSFTTYCYPLTMTDDQISTLEKARGRLEKSTAIRSNDAHSYLLLGRTNCMLGDTHEAVVAYQHFTELRPENPLGHMELALAYERQGQCWERDYSNITTLPTWEFGVMSCDKNTQETIREEWRIANLKASDLYQTLEQTREDHLSTNYLNWVDRVLWFQPQDPNIWYQVGSSFEKLNQWQLAHQAYLQGIEQASSDAPGFSNLYYKIGRIYFDNFDPPNLDEAVQAFESGIQHDLFLTDWEKSDSHYQLGLIFRQQKRDPKEYADEFSKAIDIYPSHGPAHIALGIVSYAQFSDLETAKREFLTALDIAPQSKWAYFHLGRVFQIEGLAEDAIRMYQEALKIDPDFELAQNNLNELLDE